MIETDVVKGNRIIEKIHNDFFSKDAEIDIRVQSELKIAYDEERKKVNDKLNSIGFVNTQSGELFKKEVIEANEELNDLLNEYAIAYPGYKFITDENITKLCKKYDLYLTTPDRFIGDIPVKNQKDIANFKSKHNDLMHFMSPDPKITNKIRSSLITSHSSYWNVRRNHYNDSTKAFLTSMIYILCLDHSYPSIANLTLNMKERALYYIKNLDPNFNGHFTAASEFFIASTLDLLDTKNLVADERTNKLTIISPNPKDLKAAPVSDPIVFKRVPRGAIIVTAWGPEASDPEVVNIKNN